MLTREENKTICSVGPDTPVGNLFRRYWNPVCTSAQVSAKDSAPLRVTLLGENFVVFRDTSGRVGVMDELCMHRGASLALGRVEDNGIRCLFHGWKFSVDGAIMDTPNHPDAKFKSRLKAPAYPVREEGGLVWAYIGPADKEPPFPRFAFMDVPEENRTAIRVNVHANYLQLLEGGADSSHVGVLHTNMARPGWVSNTFTKNTDDTNPGALEVEDNAPTLDIEATDFGFHYAAFRQDTRQKDAPIRNCRVVPIIMPSTRIIPSPSTQYTVFETPADDEHTSTFIVIHGAKPVDRKANLAILGLDNPTYWSEEKAEFTATWKDNFGQDRVKMRDTWSGFYGIEQEDAVIALSQGPIYDRSKEHLVAADRAVVHVRRQILDSAKNLENGLDPIGLRVDMAKVKAVDSNLTGDARWQELVPGHVADPSR